MTSSKMSTCPPRFLAAIVVLAKQVSCRDATQNRRDLADYLLEPTNKELFAKEDESLFTTGIREKLEDG
ncbi:unnamed protein product, partial [Amoebophrya sp. A25]|eukprot:GSA25T00004263001.1